MQGRPTMGRTVFGTFLNFDKPVERSGVISRVRANASETDPRLETYDVWITFTLAPGDATDSRLTHYAPESPFTFDNMRHGQKVQTWRYPPRAYSPEAAPVADPVF